MFTTKCETCLFNVRADGVQVGCRFDRLEKLPKEMVDNNYVIGRFCNTFRPQHWADDVNESDVDKMIDIVEDELIMPINYVINFNHNLEELKQTISSIEKMENFHRRSKIMVINDRVEYNEEIYSIITNSKFTTSRTYLIYIVSQPFPIDQAARNFVNGLVIYIEAGYIFASDFYNKIHKYVNKDMKRLYLIKSKDSEMVFFANTFVNLGGNLAKINGDGEIDNKSFVERIVAGGKPILDWEEFFSG